MNSPSNVNSNFEFIAQVFFEKYARPSDEIISDNLASIDAPEATREFAVGIAEKMKDMAQLKGVDLTYGMNAVQVMFKTPGEQAHDFIHGGIDATKPDILVKTYNNHGRMAMYSYDRASGLVAVNNFSFDAEEVRPVTEKEKNDLAFSMTRTKFLFGLSSNVLTNSGVSRITKDLAKAYSG
jgi:hypothetical protein